MATCGCEGGGDRAGVVLSGGAGNSITLSNIFSTGLLTSDDFLFS